MDLGWVNDGGEHQAEWCGGRGKREKKRRGMRELERS
jgi:hypothetical protein